MNLKNWLACVTLLACVGHASAGQRNDGAPQPYIIGGTEVPDGKYPFLAAIVGPNEQGEFVSAVCGATLVTPTLVMTAAHCIGPQTPLGRKAVLGRTHITDQAQGAVFDIASIVKHPRFDSERSPEYDIGFIELATPAFSFPLVKLPRKGQTPPEVVGEIATIAGWGVTNIEDFNIPERMHEAKVPVLEPQACAAYGATYNPELMLCSVGKGIDSCVGDSGGPMFQLAADGYIKQLSIVAYGRGCADPQYPGLYTWLGSAQLWDSLAESSEGRRIKEMLDR